MRRLLASASAVGVLAFALADAGQGVARAPSGPTKPRLAVIIVVDGLSWDRLDSWRPWFTSGLKRLLDEGAVATECRYGHLNADTGPGHASLATGAPPHVHGIAVNQWYVPSPDGTAMVAIPSASQPAPGEPDNSAKTIVGPGRLRVATLGDRLVARDPRAKVVAISDKDRSAIFLAGRDAHHAAYWYAPNDGTYTTSAAYDARSPVGAAAAAVVARFNLDKAGANLAAHLGTTWSRLRVPNPVPAPGFESGLDAYQDAIAGSEFPHDLTKAKRPLSSVLRFTSFSDRLLTDLAEDLLADDALGLGRDDVPDILAVSFSANDYASHSYGPESVEDLEVLRALDVEIGRLLDDLTTRFGKGGVLVAFSADHGFRPLPEATRRRDPKAPAGRLSEKTTLEQLNAAVSAELERAPAAPPLVYRFEGCSLWLDRAALAMPGAPDAKRVLAIVRHRLSTTWKDVVLRTFVVDAATPARSRDEIVRRASHARVPGRSGDLFVVPRFGVLVDPYDGKGSSHGSPWEYDIHVPMIFWGGGVAPHLIASPSTPYDLAPTLGAWLGVELPDATGRSLDLWPR